MRNWASSTTKYVIWLSLHPQIDLARNPRKGHSLFPDLFRIQIRGVYSKIKFDLDFPMITYFNQEITIKS
jgi:hypothetical protein